MTRGVSTPDTVTLHVPFRVMKRLEPLEFALLLHHVPLFWM